MEQRAQTSALDVAESLTGWWKLAGVDAAVSDEAVDWLVSDAADRAELTVAPVMNSASVAVVAAATIAWPSDIAQLKVMVGSGAPFPGNSYSSAYIPPVGPDTAEIMVVSDLPDAGDAEAMESQSSDAAILLRRMLAAIGVDMSHCYRTWLATTMPSTGEVPEDMLGATGDFVRHQMHIIKPKSVILLGSSACKALLDDDLMNTRVQMQNINHDGSNMVTLTTFHPRTLIARPALKAEAWRDLQMFAKGSAT